jgi:SAM-dependent methyltransferase
MEELSARYWDDRYLNDDAAWDIGSVSPPLKAYIDQLGNKDLKILIPGAGNAYEAEYLHQQGFGHVYVLDIANVIFDNIRERVPSFPGNHLIQEDFFAHHGQYDLILEQTFFCALDPMFRKSYVSQMQTILKPGGKLVGVLFNDPLNADKPPFGGNTEEYEPLFFPAFRERVFETCYNSIKPRAGRELFMILEKAAED